MPTRHVRFVKPNLRMIRSPSTLLLERPMEIVAAQGRWIALAKVAIGR